MIVFSHTSDMVLRLQQSNVILTGWEGADIIHFSCEHAVSSQRQDFWSRKRTSNNMFGLLFTPNNADSIMEVFSLSKHSLHLLWK